MKTCLYKPVFVNPQAYFVFPQLYDMQPKTDNFVEQAIFTGRLIITDLTNNQYTSYQNVNTIDFSQYADKRIKIEQYTDTGAVVLGEWIISQDTTGVKPIASYRAYDKTNDDEDRAVLKDLTGNGHDIQLYNFGFAESSGYGKYPFSFTIDINASDYITKVGYQKYCINGNPPSWLLYRYDNKKVNFRIKISNLKDASLLIKIGENSTIISEDGIYSFNKETEAKEHILVAHNSSYNFDNLVVELLPDYQGALVSDGVDDYGLCENFPILSPEKGYTIIALRSWILKNGSNQVLISDNKDSTIAEYINVNENVISSAYTRVFSFSTSIKNYFKNNGIVVCSSSRYNDLKLTYTGNTPTNPELRIFRSASVAIYALEIYDRDLTDEEIAKVKARMIAEYEEKTGNKYEEETV